MAVLTALGPLARGRRRSPLDGRSVGRRGPRGVGRVLSESFFPFANTLFELGDALPVLLMLPEDEDQGRLGSRRDLVPQLSRDRRLKSHDTELCFDQLQGKFDP